MSNRTDSARRAATFAVPFAVPFAAPFLFVAFFVASGLTPTPAVAQENGDVDAEETRDEYKADDAPNLEGVWAQKMVMTAVSNPPIVGKVTNETITYLRVQLEQDGRRLTLKTEPCDVRIDSDFQRVRTILPDAFVGALPTDTRRGQLRRQGEDWVIEIEKSVSVTGARLRNPSHENLPDSSDDPRVVDADDDGRPGVTVRVEGMVNGKLFLVQRGWDRFWGTIAATHDKIAGRVDWNTSQKVLGSTSIFLGKQPPTEPHPNGARSNFEMRRLDGNATCSDVMGAGF